jgi:hypothetical protein
MDKYTYVAKKDMADFYENILINLGIYSTIDRPAFKTMYNRYKQLGGRRILTYSYIERTLKKCR